MAIIQGFTPRLSSGPPGINPYFFSSLATIFFRPGVRSLSE